MRGVTIKKIDKVEAPEAIPREEATEADCAADSKRCGRWRKLGEWWHQWAIGGSMPDQSAELFRQLRRDIDFVKFIALYVLHECHDMTFAQIAGTTRDAPLFASDELPPGFVPAEIEAELDEWLDDERGKKQRSAEARLKNRVNKISKFSERIYERLGLHP